jgi:hypothetical protein
MAASAEAAARIGGQNRLAAGADWAPWLAGIAGYLLSLPGHLSFHSFLTGDLGASLASTQLASRHMAGVDFAFPYGPLTLWLQQIAVALAGGRGPWGLAALEGLSTLGFAAAARMAIRRLRLGGIACGLLAIAALDVGRLAWAPVYSLESAAIAWAVVLYACNRPRGALMAGIVGAMLKPSMSVLLCAFWVGAWAANPSGHGRARKFTWLLGLPALVGIGMGALLTAHFGPHAMARLLSPAAGARNYRALGYSFFSRRYNPLLVAGANWKYFLGTPPMAWLLCTLGLGVLLVERVRRKGMGPRETASAACLLGTLAFIGGFYAHTLSFQYYLCLPLLGLALLPWAPRVAPWTLLLVGLSLAGNFTGMRDAATAWRQQRRSASTAGLWARPSEQMEWSALTQRDPPSAPPLFLGLGSPEALFPQYGPVWHGYMVEGEATPRVLADLGLRAAHASCVAIAPGWWPNHAPQAVEAARQRQPVEPGTLFTLYGCAGAAKHGSSNPANRAASSREERWGARAPSERARCAARSRADR